MISESICQIFQSNLLKQCFPMFQPKLSEEKCIKCNESLLENHVCPQGVVLCQFDECKVVIQRKNLQHHYLNDCQFVLVTCSKCKIPIRKCDDHKCHREMLKCSGCTRWMTRKQLIKHVQSKHVKCEKCSVIFKSYKRFIHHSKMNIVFDDITQLSRCQLTEKIFNLINCVCKLKICEQYLWNHVKNECSFAIINCPKCAKTHCRNAKKCHLDDNIQIGSCFLYLQSNQTFTNCMLVTKRTIHLKQ